MGKITNKPGVEIIPINDNSDKKSMEAQRGGPKVPFISDPTIVPRVQKYLESNVDKTYVDINVMADELQRNYREYARRKRSAFRAMVKKAYSVVLRSYGLEDQDSSESDDDVVSDEDDDSDDEGTGGYDNPMNKQMVDLYKNRPNLTKPKPIDENELIDISSDDSEEEQTYNNKVNGGPNTSKPGQNSGNSAKLVPDIRTQPATTTTDRGKKRKNESPPKGPQKKKKTAPTEEPKFTFKDIGGMDKTLESVCKLLLHVRHPEIYKGIGITPPRGFLLHGPPGCGKTLLANAIAGELNVPMIKVAAPELVAGVSGESEERIRELFEKAISLSPCVLFIDEIDAITPNRQNAQREMERRIVAQLLSCLDDLSISENGETVLVIGATNRPDAIDPALRRAGRFDREISLGIPDIHARTKILKVLTSKLRLSDGFDFEQVAKHTPGYVGADLLALTREAAMVAVNRLFNDIKESRSEVTVPVSEVIESEEAQVEVVESSTSEEKVEEEKKSDTSENKEKSDQKEDAEIILDDEPAKKDAEKAENGDAEAVVVVDIDEEKEAAKNTVQSTVVEPQQPDAVVSGSSPKVEEMPVDVKPLSPLEELLSWLHNKNVLNEKQIQSLYVTMEDFAKAVKCVQPSAKREGFATVPDTTWEEIGSLQNIREELQMAILGPVRHPEQFEALGVSAPAGVLLCGPPGCGKTLLAKAIANEAGINFISVNGPELLNMYVGESERAVRVCFERARNSAPCVIFFDELDALCPKRSDSREGGATMRVVNQLLTEMDGIKGRKGVFLLAASNRPDIVDPAVLRPGRLDKILYVGLPTATDRVDILRAITKNGTQPRLSADVDLEVIGLSEQCKGYTGADLAALIREAGIVALKEVMLQGSEQPLAITTEHFNRAVAKIRPSVSEKDQKHYEKLRKLFSTSAEAEVEEMELS